LRVSFFVSPILGLVAAGHGAAAVNTKHQFLISSQLANQFNLDLDLAPRRRAMRLHRIESLSRRRGVSTPPSEKRLPCHVYVDECHNYIRNDPKIQVILHTCDPEEKSG
jgi:hypothetical protein